MHKQASVMPRPLQLHTHYTTQEHIHACRVWRGLRPMTTAAVCSVAMASKLAGTTAFLVAMHPIQTSLLTWLCEAGRCDTGLTPPRLKATGNSNYAVAAWYVPAIPHHCTTESQYMYSTWLQVRPGACHPSARAASFAHPSTKTLCQQALPCK